jgi:hypothetical protein
MRSTTAAVTDPAISKARRGFVEMHRLMIDEELANVLAAFIAEVQGGWDRQAAFCNREFTEGGLTFLVGRGP